MIRPEVVRRRLDELWTRMIGFRNALVHEYADIDRGVVYQVLQQHLDDLEAFGRLFARFL